MKKKKFLAALLGLLILLQLFASCETQDVPPSGGTDISDNGANNGTTPSDPAKDGETESTPSDDENVGMEWSDITLYDYANDWVGEAFLNENRVYHAFYYVENPEYEGQYYLELNAPRTRTFIITTEEEYGNICPESPIDVDFEKEMIVLYICATNYPSEYKRHYLEKATLCDRALTVKIKPEPAPEDMFDAGSPWARCFALKTKKAEINEVIFEGIVMWYSQDGGLIG